jgi:glycosyltransferase involved in cell wall biosynthesis
MRILVATHSSLEVGGGEERMMILLVRALWSRGHQVRVADLRSFGGEQPRYSRAELIEVTRPVEIHDIDAMPLVGTRLPIPSARGLARLADLFRWADVVVFGQYYLFDIVIYLLGRINQRPIVCSQANALFRVFRSSFRDAVQESYARTIGYRLLLACDGVRVCNRDDLSFLQGHGSEATILVYPLSSEYSALVEGGPPAKSLEAPPSVLQQDPRFKVMIAGRMTHQKGVDLLAAAIRLLAKDEYRPFRSFAFYFAGTDALPAELDGLARVYPSQIVNLGVVSAQTLRSSLESADVVAVPSRYESFGMIAAEAQSLGRIVVATDVPGLRDIVVDGVTGFLIREWDPASVAAALSRAYFVKSEDPNRWAAMRAASQSHYREAFGPEVERQQFGTLLSLLERLSI